MLNGTGTSATASASAASMGEPTPTIMSGTTPNLGSLMSYKQELLGDNNWVVWKLRMTNVFSLHKVIDHVISHVPKLDISDVMALAEWTDVMVQGSDLIFSVIHLSLLFHDCPLMFTALIVFFSDNY